MQDTRMLSMAQIGERVVVVGLCTRGGMRRRLLDIGLLPGTEVVCVGRSPSGDPSAYLIRGAVIAIRNRDCQSILISSAKRDRP